MAIDAMTVIAEILRAAIAYITNAVDEKLGLFISALDFVLIGGACSK